MERKTGIVSPINLGQSSSWVFNLVHSVQVFGMWRSSVKMSRLHALNILFLLSSEQLASFNSEWLSAGEPCVVGECKYSVSSHSQLKSWALPRALWETQLGFLFDVGQAPGTLWLRNMLLMPLGPSGEFLVSTEAFRKWRTPRVLVLCRCWFIIVL